MYKLNEECILSFFKNEPTPFPTEHEHADVCVDSIYTSSVITKDLLRRPGPVQAPHLDHPQLPADPEAAELIPGQDARRGSTDQWLPHLAQGDPGAAVLPAAQHDLQHLCAVVGVPREGEVGVVVGLHRHLELGHAGWLLHILVLVLVGSGDVDPF